MLETLVPIMWHEKGRQDQTLRCSVHCEWKTEEKGSKNGIDILGNRPSLAYSQFAKASVTFLPGFSHQSCSVSWLHSNLLSLGTRGSVFPENVSNHSHQGEVGQG